MNDVQIQDDRTEEQVRATVRRVIERLRSMPETAEALSPSMGSAGATAAAFRWLAPIVKEIVFDSVRFGASLAGSRAAGPPEGEGRSGDPAAQRAGSGGGARSTAQATATRSRRRRAQADSAADNLRATMSGYTPLNNPVTLMVGLFDRFTEVEDFQIALRRNPRVAGVQPKSFAGGGSNCRWTVSSPTPRPSWIA
ncbi:MAG: hypothetical protein EXR51_05260 [Dehalococcoidia bacterium]|nr:hypothetical protein [Dehalococcoidia bacterium]